MIGIYGGSFDPIHLGHLKTAAAITKELSLKKCYLMPCSQPAIKKNLYFSDKQRLAMLKLALADYQQLSLNDSEMKQGGKSYTIQTLKRLKDENINATLCLIIGIDNFNTFKKWKNWQDFYKFTHIIVLRRPNYECDKNYNIDNFIKVTDNKLLKEQKNGLLYFANTPLIDTSSSDIRYKIKKGDNLQKYLPEKIINYIKNIK